MKGFRKSFGAAMLVLPFAAGAAAYSLTDTKASANSAPPYWEGQDCAGVIYRGEQCPVVVEREVLTLKIPDLPKTHLEGEDYASYRSCVTADYTFYNPESYDVSVTLLFPFGNLPDYVGSDENPKSSTITADGKEIECRVRHTLDYGRFQIDEDMARLSEEKCTDTFYRPELNVTPLGYNVTLPEKNFDGELRFTFDCNPNKTRILFDGSPYSFRVRNGYLTAERSFYRENKMDQSVDFYVLGDLPANVTTSLYKDDKAVGTDCVLVKQGETVPFGDFVAAKRKADSKIGETDFFNAYVEMLEDRGGNAAGVSAVLDLDETLFMRWYEYTLTIPAGGRVQNTVTAPLYPDIDGNWKPSYEYSYLLSPAQKWADFKQIDIQIETPYFLTSSSLEFAETMAENGKSFTFSRNNLPQGELTFVLTESEDTGSVLNPYRQFLLPTITAAFIIFLVLAGIAAVITVVVVYATKKKKKQ